MKIIANYPETEEGMKELEIQLSKTVAQILNRMLTDEQKELLIKKLEDLEKQKLKN